MKPVLRSVLQILILFLVASQASVYASSIADKVFVNGKILTVDERSSIVEAVAVSDGRFIAVGTNKAIDDFAGPDTAVIDLQGRTAVPGLHRWSRSHGSRGPQVHIAVDGRRSLY